MAERVDYSSDEDFEQAQLSEIAQRDAWEAEEYARTDAEDRQRAEALDGATVDQLRAALQSVTAERDRFRKALAPLEYTMHLDGEGNNYMACPECYVWKGQGHSNDCKTGAALTPQGADE